MMGGMCLSGLSVCFIPLVACLRAWTLLTHASHLLGIMPCQQGRIVEEWRGGDKMWRHDPALLGTVVQVEADEVRGTVGDFWIVYMARAHTDR